MGCSVMDDIVTTDWLAAELGKSDLRVIDATMFLPKDGRDARAEFEAEHIPGTVFLDLAEFADFPSEAKFASRMQTLGLGDGSRFVVYDNTPLHSAARAWWLLKSFGAHYVALLDGGMPKWKAEGRAIEGGRPEVRHRHFTAQADPSGLARIADVKGATGLEIVDARSAGRFSGEESEPRPGLASGHIPGSKNLPQGQLFNGDGTWMQGDALRNAFEGAGVDLGKPMITTCGSGVTAAVLSFGAHLLGKRDVRLYDGSWAEWGADASTPKAVGVA